MATIPTVPDEPTRPDNADQAGLRPAPENDQVRPPAKRPCGSCPYRTDVPSGIWHLDEYAKLPRYDAPTGEQPTGLFLCHQVDGRICAGWAGCHDMEENLALRIAALRGVDWDVLDQIRDYVSPVPLFASGIEAAEHGVARINNPDERAQRVIHELEARRDARNARKPHAR